ncbi:hypothetical protein AVEN_30681-1 [Araneus ventricosus]|uniref:Uncharacterized protein n=1 Tax=Araneus ventricosus TaxID=182803 RepID=A0A4Y2VJG7_ARAVE|nr:hypothetical protein AVEN_30681-1 [Araneus ventricosus]
MIRLASSLKQDYDYLGTDIANLNCRDGENDILASIPESKLPLSSSWKMLLAHFNTRLSLELGLESKSLLQGHCSLTLSV